MEVEDAGPEALMLGLPALGFAHNPNIQELKRDGKVQIVRRRVLT